MQAEVKVTRVQNLAEFLYGLECIQAGQETPIVPWKKVPPFMRERYVKVAAEIHIHLETEEQESGPIS